VLTNETLSLPTPIMRSQTDSLAAVVIESIVLRR
jgi:hypothetical protein